MLRKTNPIKMMLIKTNVTHKQSQSPHTVANRMLLDERKRQTHTERESESCFDLECCVCKLVFHFPFSGFWFFFLYTLNNRFWSKDLEFVHSFSIVTEIYGSLLNRNFIDFETEICKYRHPV